MIDFLKPEKNSLTDDDWTASFTNEAIIKELEGK